MNSCNSIPNCYEFILNIWLIDDSWSFDVLTVDYAGLWVVLDPADCLCCSSLL
jgi:hypothetical protein